MYNTIICDVADLGRHVGNDSTVLGAGVSRPDPNQSIAIQQQGTELFGHQ